MTVLQYCERVQLALLELEPTSFVDGPWFADTGRASKAVMLALEGRDTEAREIAEEIAERWQLVV